MTNNVKYDRRDFLRSAALIGASAGAGLVIGRGTSPAFAQTQGLTMQYGPEVFVYTISVTPDGTDVNAEILYRRPWLIEGPNQLENIVYGSGTFGPDHIRRWMGFSPNGSYAGIQEGEVIVNPDIAKRDELTTAEFSEVEQRTLQSIRESLYAGDLSVAKQEDIVLISTSYLSVSKTYLASFHTDIRESELTDVRKKSLVELPAGAVHTFYNNGIVGLAFQSVVNGMFPTKPLIAIAQYQPTKTIKLDIRDLLIPDMPLDELILHAEVSGQLAENNLATLFTVYTVLGIGEPPAQPSYTPNRRITPSPTATSIILTETPEPTPTPALGNPGNTKDVGHAGETPNKKGGWNEPDDGPGEHGQSDPKPNKGNNK